MKSLLAAAATALFLCSMAQANQITRTVQGGRTTAVSTYSPMKPPCQSTHGVATLVAKPEHGSVSHHLEPTTIPLGHPARRCYGKPTTGFVVTYTPAPGFRGVDHFILDVNLPELNVHRLDGFAIIVQ
jgi:hypothetical protein